MGGKVPFEAKVVRCANNSLAKVLLPNTVDGDPGGKGVVGMGEVFGQLQAAILDFLFGGCLRFKGRNHRHKPRANLGSGPSGISFFEQMQRLWLSR